MTATMAQFGITIGPRWGSRANTVFATNALKPPGLHKRAHMSCVLCPECTASYPYNQVNRPRAIVVGSAARGTSAQSPSPATGAVERSTDGTEGAVVRLGRWRARRSAVYHA